MTRWQLLAGILASILIGQVSILMIVLWPR